MSREKRNLVHCMHLSLNMRELALRKARKRTLAMRLHLVEQQEVAAAEAELNEDDARLLASRQRLDRLKMMMALQAKPACPTTPTERPSPSRPIAFPPRESYHPKHAHRQPEMRL